MFHKHMSSFLYIIAYIIYGTQLKNELPTYLLIVKNMSRIMANQHFFKDGFIHVVFTKG